jgi:hypothetical protein
MVAMSVGVLIGALAGLYLGVVSLVLLTIIALLGMAILDMANGPSLQTALYHMGCIWIAIQLAYVGSAALVGRSQHKNASNVVPFRSRKHPSSA